MQNEKIYRGGGIMAPIYLQYILYNNLVNQNLNLKFNDYIQSIVQSILNSKLRNIYYTHNIIYKYMATLQ